MKFVILLGISYFSFKLMYYVIECGYKLLFVYLLKDFFFWLFLLLIFIFGLIECFEYFVEYCEDCFWFDFVVEGGSCIVLGLIKKFMILFVFE